MAKNSSLAAELVRMHALVEGSKLAGPKTEQLLALLAIASALPEAKQQQPDDGRDSAGNDYTPPPKPKRTRPARPVPPGTWNPNRERTMVLGGRDFDAPTIARGVCAVFTAELEGFKADDATIAGAVQHAFPENVYKEYRVHADRVKFAKGLFKFQG